VIDQWAQLSVNTSSNALTGIKKPLNEKAEPWGLPS
jgi:hypothetical protein